MPPAQARNLSAIDVLKVNTKAQGTKVCALLSLLNKILLESSKLGFTGHGRWISWAVQCTFSMIVSTQHNQLILDQQDQCHSPEDDAHGTKDFIF